jgi:hypothetical protein
MAKKPKETPPALAAESVEMTENQAAPVNMEEFNVESEEEMTSIEEGPSAEFLATIDTESDTGDTADTGGSWTGSKKVTALWSVNQAKNAYARISDVGWQKLADNDGTAVEALNILTSHAREHNRNVNARIDKNRIVEIYVW